MPHPGQAAELDIDGRRLAIRHLDRVIFPRTGTTKAQLLTYYVAVASGFSERLRHELLEPLRR